MAAKSHRRRRKPWQLVVAQHKSASQNLYLFIIPAKISIFTGSFSSPVKTLSKLGQIVKNNLIYPNKKKGIDE